MSPKIIRWIEAGVTGIMAVGMVASYVDQNWPNLTLLCLISALVVALEIRSK